MEEKKQPKILKTIEQVAKDAQARQEQQKNIQTAANSLEYLEELERYNMMQRWRKQMIAHKPETPEQLYKSLQILFNVDMPYTSTHPDFDAPFTWFANLFFGKAQTSVALASRGSGKTFYGSILHYYWNTFWDSGISRHAAATKEQAKVASGYLHDFSKDKALATVFVRNELNKTEARWKNNSHWAIVTGSMQGVSGQHPDKATWDEIEFWDKADIEQTWAVPIQRDDKFRIWAAFSTRQRSFGAMNWLVDKAQSDNSLRLFKWSAFETMQRCQVGGVPTCHALAAHPYGTEAERMKVCNLWEDCHGERGTKSTGWYPRAHVMQLKREMSENSWKTQGLCEKPASHGLVLYNFEHLQKPYGNYADVRFDPKRPWYAAYDPSEGKKSVIYFIQIDDDGNDYVFDEINDPECPNASKAKVDFYEKCSLLGYGDPEIVVVDPHRTDAIKEWRAGSPNGVRGGRSYRADAPPIDKKSGGQEIHKTVDFLRHAIRDGEGLRHLFINPRTCPGAVNGIKEYHYPVDKQGEITSDTPDKAYSDEIDPLRYWIMYKRTKLKNRSGRVWML